MTFLAGNRSSRTKIYQDTTQVVPGLLRPGRLVCYPLPHIPLQRGEWMAKIGLRIVSKARQELGVVRSHLQGFVGAFLFAPVTEAIGAHPAFVGRKTLGISEDIHCRLSIGQGQIS